MPRGSNRRVDGYTIGELKILWYLKIECGGIMHGGSSPSESPIKEMASVLDLPPTTVKGGLRTLEDKALILRTYKRPKSEGFTGNQGFNPLLRIEMVDPNMDLPMLPLDIRQQMAKPKPEPIIEDAMPVTVIQRENAEMFSRSEHEPTTEAVVLALLTRNEELREQIAKLHEVIASQQEEIESKTKTIASMRDRPRRPEHLNSRIKDALTPEQWDAITH